MFRSLAVSSLFFSSLLVGGAGAATIESSSSFSSPRDALAVFEKVIHSASSLMTAGPHHGLEDRNLQFEGVSQTCHDESMAAIEATQRVDLAYISSNPSLVESHCTYNSAKTNIRCDVSQFPGVNDVVVEACTEGGDTYIEMTFVMSSNSVRMELNNMGYCVGSSCSTDELQNFFDGCVDAFETFNTSGISISFTLEEPGVDTYNPTTTVTSPTTTNTSSAPLKMLSSFAAGAIAASVGLVSLFLA